MKAVFLDPSINMTAAALFDTAKCRKRTMQDSTGYSGAAYGFIHVETCRVKGVGLTNRCVYLASWLTDLIVQNRVRMVAIEVPYMAGTYRGRRKRQRTKGSMTAASEAKLNQAIAALRVAAAQTGAEVVDVPARYNMSVKGARHDLLNRMMRLAGKPELKGNADERDAAFLGLFYLGQHLNP